MKETGEIVEEERENKGGEGVSRDIARGKEKGKRRERVEGRGEKKGMIWIHKTTPKASHQF